MELKALVDWGKFRVIVFQHSAKMITRNLVFSLSNMIPRIIEKFRVMVFMSGTKNHNLELGIHLTGNSEIFEFFENSELSL